MSCRPFACSARLWLVFALFSLAACDCGDGAVTARLTLTEPTVGAVFGVADDADPEAPGFQVRVVVAASGLPEGERITLHLDSSAESDDGESSLDAVGQASLVVTVGDGMHRVEARARDGAVRSGARAFVVMTRCERSITFVDPRVVADELVFGPDEDEDGEACGASFSTHVTVSTDAPSGSTARLFVDDVQVATSSVVDTVVRFDEVELGARGGASHRFAVEIGPDATCRAELAPAVRVDCDGVSCVISAPDRARPVLGVEDDVSEDPGLQIDVEVTTDADAVDHSARLIVDGDETGAEVAVVAARGEGGIALFANRTLDEGLRRVQAECADPNGNVTRSAAVEWLVDTTPCEVAIERVAGFEVAALPPLTEADDLDAVTAGVQVAVRGAVDGDGCTALRVGPCASVETLGPLSFDEEGAFDATVTLATSSSQTLCASVRDASGNRADVSVPVSLRVDAPSVEIESPTEGTRINRQPGDARLDDLDPSTVECDVAFSVLCSEIGEPVTLLDVATSTLVATESCEGADDVAPPYAGRATFAAVALPSRNDGSVIAITARHDADRLSGLATAIALAPDCEAPTLTVTRPTCGAVLRPGTDDEGVAPGMQYDTAVLDANEPSTPVTLEIRGPPDGAGARALVYTATSDMRTGVVHRFDAAEYGSGGENSVVAYATDAAGNRGTTAACSVAVDDVPIVRLVAPSNFSVSTAADDCSSADGFQLAVVATTSAPDSAEATIVVGARPPVAAAITGGRIQACVDAPEGSGLALSVRVAYEGLVGRATATITIDTQPPLEPIDDLDVSVSDRRRGRMRFTWTAVPDSGGGALLGYALRCARTPIATEADWASASRVAIPTAPAAPGAIQSVVLGGFRTGSTRHCALRGVDAAGASTPLAPSIPVSAPFDTLELPFAADAGIGRAIAAIGDVDGDGADDWLVGGTGAAYVFAGATPGRVLSSTPRVTFLGASADFFGHSAAGVGDVNGDGRPDFAVGAPLSGGNRGAVYVFYGRDAARPWPSRVDLTLGACAADVCLVGQDAAVPDDAFSFFGWSVAGAGDFDADGRADLAIGAPGVDAVSGAVYVLLGSNVASGTRVFVPGTSADPALQPAGFYVPAPPSTKQFGNSVAYTGQDLDGDGVADLAVAAPGDVATSTRAQLWLLYARDYVGPGLEVVRGFGLSQLDSGVAGEFAAVVAGAGDVNGDRFRDLLVHNPTAGGRPIVYLGDESGYSSLRSLAIVNDAGDVAGDLFGASPALGAHPWFTPRGQMFADLDGDGRDEVAVGSAQYGTGPGAAHVFYGQSVWVSTVRSRADVIFRPSTAGAATRTVASVGDVDGDGHPDLVVAERPSASTMGGRLFVLH